MSEEKKGILYAAAAYFMWGVLPMYWKLVQDFNPYESLFHRIIWSFVFVILLVVVTNKITHFKNAWRYLMSHPKESLLLTLASIVITFNWGIFIYAVHSGHVLQASLGYYINPLMSIALGFLVLKERFNKLETFAIFLVAIGVFYMTFSIGEFPAISFVLALSFALYGLIKKFVHLDALMSILFETMITLPFALLAIFYMTSQHQTHFLHANDSYILLLSGIITAVPLICFSAGAKRISLSIIGLLQYIGPTLMLLQGVFLYHETFSTTHLVTFMCIWIGLVAFSYSKVTQFRKMRYLK